MDTKSKRIKKKFPNSTKTFKKTPHVFSPYVFSLCLPSFLNTWQKVTGKIGQLEAVKLNLKDSMVCVEDQKKDRAKNKNLCQ